MEELFKLQEFDELIGDYDRDFIIYGCRWVTQRLLECNTEEELDIFKHTITLKLKGHMGELSEFMHISHAPDELSTEEMFQAAKRYENHIIHTCSIVWSLFTCGNEEKIEPDV